MLNPDRHRAGALQTNVTVILTMAYFFAALSLYLRDARHYIGSGTTLKRCRSAMTKHWAKSVGRSTRHEVDLRVGSPGASFQHDPMPEISVDFGRQCLECFSNAGHCWSYISLVAASSHVHVSCIPNPPIVARIERTLVLSTEEAARYTQLIRDANLEGGPFVMPDSMSLSKADELYQWLEMQFAVPRANRPVGSAPPRGVSATGLMVTNNPTFAETHHLCSQLLEETRRRVFDEELKKRNAQ